VEPGLDPPAEAWWDAPVQNNALRDDPYGYLDPTRIIVIDFEDFAVDFGD
jgi:hypothetical protein